jgi:hypothetical protein
MVGDRFQDIYLKKTFRLKLFDSGYKTLTWEVPLFPKDKEHLHP